MHGYNPRLPSAWNFTTIENLKAYKNCKRMGIDRMREKQRTARRLNDEDSMLYQALVHNDVNPNNMDELTNFRYEGYKEPGKNTDKINHR